MELLDFLDKLPGVVLVPLSILLYMAIREFRALREALPSKEEAQDLSKMTSKLLEMHEHPENTGFGTVELGPLIKQLAATVENLGKVIQANADQTGALVTWVQWVAKERDMGSPPPRVPK